jgi:hypothetical protein
MKHKSRFEKALQAPNPGQALRSLALEMGSEGHTRQEVYRMFEAFLLDIRQAEQPNLEKEDLILDTMDALTDWCHPDAQLLKDK